MTTGNPETQFAVDIFDDKGVMPNDGRWTRFLLEVWFAKNKPNMVQVGDRPYVHYIEPQTAEKGMQLHLTIEPSPWGEQGPYQEVLGQAVIAWAVQGDRKKPAPNPADYLRAPGEAGTAQA